jgi:hypothetical protein
MTVQEISQTAGVSDAAKALIQPESTPPTYLDALEKQEMYLDAIRFLAYKLSTDAGVKWAIACARELQAPDRKEKDDALEAADRWSKAPSDPVRRAAKDAADNSTQRGPGKMIAYAVFFSGGSVAAPQAPETPPPPYSAQKFIAGSVQVAVVSHEPSKAKERYKKALALGKLAG